jgi:pimeloyl-ACP methyl ester carboxylesterase
MVLVDTQTRDYDSRYYSQFPPAALAAMKEDLASKPENLDQDDLFGAMDDLRRAPLSLGDKPLIVLHRGKPRASLFGIPEDSWGKLETEWRAMEGDVASLSRNSDRVVVPEAGWIPDDAPDRVVDATWRVVSSVRSGVPLSRLARTSPPPATPAHPTVATAAPGSRAVPDDGMVDVGDRSLHLHCVGQGAPAVVMENGHGADGESWSLVLGDIGHLSRVCVYDRPGIGLSSGPAPRRHSFRQMAHELHALLERAGIRGPYVLVAHSMGGINVRLFQAEHPSDVVGMVFVDVSSEHEPPMQLEPEKAREMMRDDREGVDYDTALAGLADLRAASRPLGDMPLVVLSAGVPEEDEPGVSKDRLAEQHEKWIASHETLAHLSTNSAHVVADHSAHFIQIDAPRLVVASVKQVLDAVRNHARVNGAALEALRHEGAPGR